MFTETSCTKNLGKDPIQNIYIRLASEASIRRSCETIFTNTPGSARYARPVYQELSKDPIQNIYIRLLGTYSSRKQVKCGTRPVYTTRCSNNFPRISYKIFVLDPWNISLRVLHAAERSEVVSYLREVLTRNQTTLSTFGALRS